MYLIKYGIATSDYNNITHYKSFSLLTCVKSLKTEDDFNAEPEILSNNTSTGSQEECLPPTCKHQSERWVSQCKVKSLMLSSLPCGATTYFPHVHLTVSLYSLRTHLQGDEGTNEMLFFFPFSYLPLTSHMPRSTVSPRSCFPFYDWIFENIKTFKER